MERSDFNMTPEQFKDKMLEIIKTNEDDPENAHPEADDLLCDLLKELGYGEGIKLYKEMEKWYY